MLEREIGVSRGAIFEGTLELLRSALAPN